MTKDELLDALEDEREKFLDAIDGLSEEDMELPGAASGWSVKQVIFHMNMWEAETIKALWQIEDGKKPGLADLSEEEIEVLNARWAEEALARPLDLVLEDFHSIRNQTNRRVRAISDRNLNDSQRFTWLNGSPLWELVADETYLHEADHRAEILSWRAS